jgi:hypothetical protein
MRIEEMTQMTLPSPAPNHIPSAQPVKDTTPAATRDYDNRREDSNYSIWNGHKRTPVSFP